MRDLDDEYAIGIYIRDGEAYPDRWSAAAQDFRSVEQAIGRAMLNLPYGEGDRQRYDLFLPAGRPEGLTVFIHGGYWQKFDRPYWSHFARGLTARDWAVAMPSYDLCPDVTLAQIAPQIAAAVTAAAARVPGPIRITGHSAGGHLSARMGADGMLPAEVAERIARIIPISPVADLRPLLQTAMAEPLGLTPGMAEAESPALHPSPNMPVSVWVGAEERPTFLDQARWLAEAWNAAHRIAPGRDHFDILDLLEDPESPLVRDILA